MLWGWDLVASDPISINPLGTGGGKCRSPHQGRVWGSSVGDFPASPSCCWNFGGAACLPCPLTILVRSGLSPLQGRMEITKVGSHCPPVMGSAPHAFLRMFEGKDLMFPHVPSMELFPPFILTVPLSARIKIFFFSPFFFFFL